MLSQECHLNSDHWNHRSYSFAHLYAKKTMYMIMENICKHNSPTCLVSSCFMTLKQIEFHGGAVFN